MVKTGQKSKKAIKSIKYLEKISKQFEKVFRKRLLNIKGDKKASSSVSYEYENFVNSKKNKSRSKMNKNEYFNFFDIINTKIEKINKQEKEIKNL